MKLFIITGTCGAGKSTMKDYLVDMLNIDEYAVIDSDEVGLNWWDWFRRNKSKFQLFIDNSDIPEEDTAKVISSFIRKQSMNI